MVMEIHGVAHINGARKVRLAEQSDALERLIAIDCSANAELTLDEAWYLADQLRKLVKKAQRETRGGG